MVGSRELVNPVRQTPLLTNVTQRGTTTWKIIIGIISTIVDDFFPFFFSLRKFYRELINGVGICGEEGRRRGHVIADIERDERNMINTARLMKS